MAEKKSGEIFYSQQWQPFGWHEEERWPAPQKLVILTAAPGATISREQNPNLPITPKEIVENHVQAYKAGASVVHIHVRNEKGLPVFDPELLKRVILEIKGKCPDVIIDCCLSHPHSEDTVEARCDPLFNLGLPIEMATMSAGTFNTRGQDIYVNREAYLKASVKYMQERKGNRDVGSNAKGKDGRVESWRSGLCPISSSPSSNRACSFPAHGFPIIFFQRLSQPAWPSGIVSSEVPGHFWSF